MRDVGIPTADFSVFTNYDEAMRYVQEKGVSIVVKASGLALGKGVAVCRTLGEAETALKEIMLDRVFKDAGTKVVIERYLEGQEVSIHALSDGKTHVMFPVSQDHKTIGEGDTGKNTGGMGVIAPLSFVSAELMQEIERMIVKPTFDALRKKGIEYSGILYPGLKLTSMGPKVLEYNARFGDPECQVYMRLLKTDLLDILDACVDGIGEAEKVPGVVVFHASTQHQGPALMTAGGRVLSVSAVGATLKSALDRAYEAVGKVRFEGMYFRRDIGAKSL